MGFVPAQVGIRRSVMEPVSPDPAHQPAQLARPPVVGLVSTPKRVPVIVGLVALRAHQVKVVWQVHAKLKRPIVPMAGPIAVELASA